MRGRERKRREGKGAEGLLSCLKDELRREVLLALGKLGDEGGVEVVVLLVGVGDVATLDVDLVAHEVVETVPLAEELYTTLIQQIL